MDIFGDLESLGLKKIDNVDIFAEDEPEDKNGATAPVKAEKVINEADFLFDKSMTCPVCQGAFKTKKVRTGKPRFVGMDTDLRPVYEGVDTIKYDAIVCNHCGYASLERMYSNVTSHQIKEIREQISKNFKEIPASHKDIYTYDEAIQRYKLTLLNCVVRKMKMSERAYVCLKIAWLYRGMGQRLDESDKNYEQKKQECSDNERSFIQKAYEGFTMAYSKESMPICGMDQNTFSYLMADLARQCKDYDNADKYIYEVIGARTASSSVREKARNLHEMIKNDRANG